MKISLFGLLFALCLSQYAHAQALFEEGYIINNDFQRVDGLIQNKDWRFNPDQINFKKNISAPLEVISLQDMLEFSVPKKFRYKKVSIDIDMSPDKFENLSVKREVENERKTVFLSYVIEGSISLLEYKNNVVTKFFIENGDGEIVPLIYKQYRAKEGGISENLTYKSQLFEMLSSRGINSNKIAKLDYTRKSLLELFQDETIHDGDVILYDNSGNREGFNFRVNAGAFMHSLRIFNEGSNRDLISYENTIAPRLALEMEYVFPFANNKYSAFLEPSFIWFTQELPPFGGAANSPNGQMSFRSLKLGLGLRAKFPINQNVKIFCNVVQAPDLFLGGQLTYPGRLPFDVNPEIRYMFTGYAFGAGVNFKEFSIELRYAFRRGLAIFSSFIDQYYSGTNLIIGYNLFNKK
jgi:hypothetical protein